MILIRFVRTLNNNLEKVIYHFNVLTAKQNPILGWEN